MDLMDYRRKIIANSPHLKSASGAVVTFSDGADLPLKSLLVYIEPVQSGSGDPSPTNIRPISGWSAVKVTRTGKNLWNPVSSYPATGNEVTYSRNTDGSIHVQGTANGQSNNYPIASNGMSISAGTYTMSVRTTDPNIHFIFGGGNGTAGIAYTDMVNGSKKTFTTNGGTTGHNIIRVNSGATVNGDIYIQLEKGSTATPWESYNGVNVAIDLGQTVYGGTLNVLTGVLTVTHGMLVKNTSTMDTTNDSYPGWFNSGIKALVGSGKNTTLNCLLNIGTRIGVNTNNVNDSVFLTKAIYGKTKAEWIALAMDVQIVVELATPFEIQLTPQQIRTLYGSNTIFADTGDTSLEYWAHP